MDLLVLGLLQKILSGSGNTVIDVIIDAILSETSENPVQNKVVTKALKNKADISHKHTAVEVGADSIGSAETALNDAKKYTDGKIADIINGAPSTLDTLSEIATAMYENKSVVDALDKAIGTKANKADIPTKTSELENDSNFLTEHQDLSSYAKTEDIPTELPANGGNADTVNNHTVNTDVPSDAVFTDTVYTLPKATTEILGGVMPDGTSITVDENGVISAVGSGEGGGVTIDSALSDTSENPVQNKIITSVLNNKAESNHVHSYAGSSSEGGSATSAVKLDSSAGSTVNPVYFSEGKPVACTYTLGKSVPSNAVFTDTVYTLPKATTSVLGGVKVDGTTIAVDSNGVISTAGGLTVDTLLDITASFKNAEYRDVYLEKNITDYKFIHCASGTIGTVNGANSFTLSNFKTIPTSMFNWKTWEVAGTNIGTPFWTYKVNTEDVTFFYSSNNHLCYRPGSYLGVPTNFTEILSHRILILGIK